MGQFWGPIFVGSEKMAFWMIILRTTNFCGDFDRFEEEKKRGQNGREGERRRSQRALQCE
jgi:hypothetical protein